MILEIGTRIAYNELVGSVPVTVVEMPEFLKKADQFFDEAERADLIFFLASNPEAGDMMKGTGGVRKIRWGIEGRGKSGGVRVIYYFHGDNMPLIALDLFAKNEKPNLTKNERNQLRALMPEIVRHYRKGKGK